MNEILEFMKMEKKQKLEKYRVLNAMAKKDEILFTGSSLMEQFPINELLMTNNMSNTIYNRGIGGFTTGEMLEYLEEMVFGTRPSKIFINIGTNDMGIPEYKLDELLLNYKKILMQIKEKLPIAEVYIMAYYPVNEVDKVPDNEWGTTLFVQRNNKNIDIANKALQEMAGDINYKFIDVNTDLTDGHGRLKKEFTVEGIHMYANAYQVILDNLKKYL